MQIINFTQCARSTGLSCGKTFEYVFAYEQSSITQYGITRPQRRRSLREAHVNKSSVGRNTALRDHRWQLFNKLLVTQQLFWNNGRGWGAQTGGLSRFIKTWRSADVLWKNLPLYLSTSASNMLLTLNMSCWAQHWSKWYLHQFACF